MIRCPESGALWNHSHAGSGWGGIAAWNSAGAPHPADHITQPRWSPITMWDLLRCIRITRPRPGETPSRLVGVAGAPTTRFFVGEPSWRGSRREDRHGAVD